MLKIDEDAQTYAERYEVMDDWYFSSRDPYLQIMVAESSADNQIDSERGIYFSVNINTDQQPVSCPVVSDDGDVWNPDGGGGVRDFALESFLILEPDYVSELDAVCFDFSDWVYWTDEDAGGKCNPEPDQYITLQDSDGEEY